MIKLVTPLPGPKAKAIIERDRARVSPSYTRDYPFVMAKGAGAVVEDVDGNVFLDCAAGIAVNSTGHSHPDVVKAITDQAQKFLHMSGTDFYYDVQVRLAEEVAAIVGDTHPLVLDVRTPGEWDEKHIEPSVNIPLNHLVERVAEVPRDRPLVVLCAGGYRSSIAASLLEQRNFTDLVELAGGIAAWETASMPLLSSGHH